MARKAGNFSPRVDERGESGVIVRADDAPPEEFCEILLGKLRVHLKNGNWPLADNSLQAGYAEWQERREELRAELARTPAEWLDRPLADFDLPVRLVNACEEVGCLSMRSTLEFFNAGERIPNVGEVQINLIWAAADGKQIKVERRVHLKPGGKNEERTSEEQERIEKVTRRFVGPKHNFTTRSPLGDDFAELEDSHGEALNALTLREKADMVTLENTQWLNFSWKRQPDSLIVRHALLRILAGKTTEFDHS